jgi:hypothetical protein
MGPVESEAADDALDDRGSVTEGDDPLSAATLAAHQGISLVVLLDQPSLSLLESPG